MENIELLNFIEQEKKENEELKNFLIFLEKKKLNFEKIIRIIKSIECNDRAKGFIITTQGDDRILDWVLPVWEGQIPNNIIYDMCKGCNFRPVITKLEEFKYIKNFYFYDLNFKKR